MQSEARLRRPWCVGALAVLAFTAFWTFGCGAAQNDLLGTHQVLYVGNEVPNTVSAFAVNSKGLLTAVSASPFALGGSTLIADPKGKVLFSFGLNPDTVELNLNTDSVALDGSLKMSSRVVDNSLAGVRATNPAGNALYVSSINATENNRGWKVYSIQPGGTLQFIDGLIDQVAGRLVFTPDGTTAFAAYCYFFLPNIEQFTVDSNGKLTNTKHQIDTAVPFGECPNTVAITPAGNMLAAPWSAADTSGSGGNFITLFNLDPGTHALNPVAGFEFPASGAGQDAIFDPSGQFLISAQDNGVGVYRVGNNSLAEVRGSPFVGARMDRVIFTPLGKFIVATSRATEQIFVFAFNSATGTLIPAPGSPVSTSTPSDLAIIQQ